MARPSDPKAKGRLLSAAERVFIAHGLDRAKVEDITRAAGLSKGAFYLHFKTKDDAFKEILSSALAELGHIVNEVEAARESWVGRPHAELFQHWLEQDLKIFECLWRHRAIMKLVLDGGGSPDYHHLIDVFADGAEQTSLRLVTQGMVLGYYRADLDPPQAAAFVAGGYDRLARRLVREKKKPALTAWLIRAQTLCISALGTPEFVRACVNVNTQRLSESGHERVSA